RGYAISSLVPEEPRTRKTLTSTMLADLPLRVGRSCGTANPWREAQAVSESGVALRIGCSHRLWWRSCRGRWKHPTKTTTNNYCTGPQGRHRSELVVFRPAGSENDQQQLLHSQAGGRSPDPASPAEGAFPTRQGP